MKKNLIFLFVFICAIKTCSLEGMNENTFKNSELNKENAFKKENAPECLNAFECLEEAQYFLNNCLDFKSANKWFLRAYDLYNLYDEKEVTGKIKIQKAQAIIGLAMSYYRMEDSNLRLKYLLEAKKMLNLPDNASEYVDETKFNENAIAYFMVYGYYLYIAYEQSEQTGDKIEQKENFLKSALESFLKSIEISTKLKLEDKNLMSLKLGISNKISNETAMRIQAVKGLGKTLEFLGKCAKIRNDLTQAKNYFAKSIKTFKTSFKLRKMLFGKNDLSVARSLHKLPRNRVLLAEFFNENDSEEKKDLLDLADTNYKKAIKIFEKNKISHEHEKRKELEDEYAIFKEKCLHKN